MLSVETLVFGFGDHRVLDDVSVEIDEGEFVCVLGPSGCGKTTLLNCVAGFYRPAGGTICLDGRDVTRLPAEARKCGVVFQDYALFPHMTMFENIAFGLRVRKVRAEAVKARVEEMADLVGLGTFLDRYPAQLSGGQRQRVALARALAPDPKLLLLDEPLTALDRALRVQLQAELRRLHRTLAVTVLMVTHDPEEAMSLSDRIILLSEGKILQMGPPAEVYEQPTSPLAMNYLGRTSEIRGTVSGQSSRGISIALNGSGRELVIPRGQVRADIAGRDSMCVMMRPDRLLIYPDADSAGDGGPESVGQLEGVVLDIVPKGATTDVVVGLKTGETVVAARSSTDDVLRSLVQDQAVRLSIPAAAVQCYQAD